MPMLNLHALILHITFILFFLCTLEAAAKTAHNNDFDIKSNTTSTIATRYSDTHYIKKLQGFWLGQSIANWTGLITEMDKIGTPETMPFYTDDDWGKKT